MYKNNNDLFFIAWTYWLENIRIMEFTEDVISFPAFIASLISGVNKQTRRYLLEEYKNYKVSNMVSYVQRSLHQAPLTLYCYLQGFQCTIYI